MKSFLLKITYETYLFMTYGEWQLDLRPYMTLKVTVMSISSIILYGEIFAYFKRQFIRI